MSDIEQAVRLIRFKRQLQEDIYEAQNAWKPLVRDMADAMDRGDYKRAWRAIEELKRLAEV